MNALGENVPYSFVPKTDRMKESLAVKIHKLAIGLEKDLQAFHAVLNEAFVVIDKTVKDEYMIKHKAQKKEGKGGLSWFNFDRSLKIEASVDEIVKWDGPLMTEALQQLNNYLNASMTDANLLIADLVKSAFANTKGMIDSKKVFQILRYEDKIKNKWFQQACTLMKKAQGIDKTKLYMRIWEKTDSGEYRHINLNFSSL